jgi:urease accessory protein
VTVGFLALVLADSRLPTGTHAHSNGTEQAVDEGLVNDLASLRDWITGRFYTCVALEAHAAARACVLVQEGGDATAFDRLDKEVDARMASPATRLTSHRQGGQYFRTAKSVLDSAMLARLEDWSSAPHLCVAIGAAAAAAGLGPVGAANLAAYQGIVSPATAALRLLGLDPVGVAAVIVSFAPGCDAIAKAAGAVAHDRKSSLPALQAPQLDRLMEIHRAREESLFAS